MLLPFCLRAFAAELFRRRAPLRFDVAAILLPRRFFSLYAVAFTPLRAASRRLLRGDAALLRAMLLFDNMSYTRCRGGQDVEGALYTSMLPLMRIQLARCCCHADAAAVERHR